MIIHYYTLCWNEEKILPFVLKYYSEYCDKMVFYDNQSTDNSHQIINSFKNTEIKTFATNNQLHDGIQLELKNNVWKESRGIADWVIVCDTDEMLYHPHFIKKLEELKEKNVSIIKPHGYEMVSESFPEKDFLEIKTGVKDNRHLGKCIIFNPNLISEINFKAGCHQCAPKGKVKFYKRKDFKLLHYKYLGMDYLINRFDILKNRLSHYNIENRFGKHYLIEKKNLELRLTKLKKQIKTNYPMKTTKLILAFCLLLISLSNFAQRQYSKTALESYSESELNQRFIQSTKLSKAGATSYKKQL